MRKQDKYTDDFKAGIVRLVKEQGKTYKQIQQDYDVGLSAVGRWVRDAGEIKVEENGTTKIITTAQYKKVLADKVALQEEVDILKKPLPSSCLTQTKSKGHSGT